MTTVKQFMFRDLPNDALFELALESIGKRALELASYEYIVGFYTHPDYKYGADGKPEYPDYQPFKDINDYLLESGCEVNEVVYLKW